MNSFFTFRDYRVNRKALPYPPKWLQQSGAYDKLGFVVSLLDREELWCKKREWIAVYYYQEANKLSFMKSTYSLQEEVWTKWKV